MGSNAMQADAEQQADGTVELWRAYQDEFPVTRNLVYLNHAAVSPLSRGAARAMCALADDVCEFGSQHYDVWLDAYEGLRVAAARLIGAHRDEIALVKNTSEGIAMVAMGLDWRSGDKIVAFKEEFPANYFPWLRLESRGVQIEWLSIYDSLDRIDEACAGARLLAISFVNYLSGFRADVNAIGEICKRREVFFFVDAIQGLGALPLDVNAAHIDALAADGHKWLTGPEGCAVLYVRKDRQDEIDPVEFGWTNVAGFNDYASRDLALRPDAGRYEPGTLNTIGIFGLRAAIEILLHVGVGKISGQIHALVRQVAEGAVRKGYELLRELAPDSGSGIVAFRKADLDSDQLVGQLKEKQIIMAPRQGWVRCSPHFYISPDSIDRMLAALP